MESNLLPEQSHRLTSCSSPCIEHAVVQIAPYIAISPFIQFTKKATDMQSYLSALGSTEPLISIICPSLSGLGTGVMHGTT